MAHILHPPPDKNVFVVPHRQTGRMALTQYYTATSIDGYLADERGSLDWLFEVERDDDKAFEEFFAGVGAFAMGATTYEWAREHDPDGWSRWYGDTPAWVFTHRELPSPPGARVTFVQGDVRPVHDAMVDAAGGRNVWLVGGGELVGAFADHGLLDEILLGVAPVTLGAGAPLLPRRLLSSRLRLTEVRQSGQFARLVYRVG
jgi:dihydrofolate reductase